jgi:hypothetical protein
MEDHGDINEEQEAAPAEDTSPITSIESEAEVPPKDSMEVHHHPDLHHKKKKFREYILEFIMIFLAVTLGFFAEGLREHMSENTRAKEYAAMLLKDVVKDTIELKRMLVQYRELINNFDTLQDLRRTEGSKMNDFDFWYYSYPAFIAGRISFNDAALQQVKNSGNLRLFHGLKLKEKISEYDNITRTFALRLEIELNWVPVLNAFNNNLFDYDARIEITDKFHRGVPLDSLRKKNFHLLVKNPEEINRFFNFCDYRKGNWKGRIDDNINPTLEVARSLIAMLKNEYDIQENE